MSSIAEHKIVMPLVHLNGTSARSLYDQRGDAVDALIAAREAIQGMAPNARDYYPAGPEEYEKAVAQHQRRLRVLNDLQAEITAEMEHVSDFVVRRPAPLRKPPHNPQKQTL